MSSLTSKIADLEDDRRTADSATDEGKGTTGKEAGDNKAEVVEVDSAVDWRSDYLTAAVNAFGALDGIDGVLMGKNFERRIKDLKRKSFEIIEYVINELHGDLFPGNDI